MHASASGEVSRSMLSTRPYPFHPRSKLRTVTYNARKQCSRQALSKELGLSSHAKSRTRLSAPHDTKATNPLDLHTRFAFAPLLVQTLGLPQAHSLARHCLQMRLHPMKHFRLQQLPQSRCCSRLVQLPMHYRWPHSHQNCLPHWRLGLVPGPSHGHQGNWANYRPRRKLGLPWIAWHPSHASSLGPRTLPLLLRLQFQELAPVTRHSFRSTTLERMAASLEHASGAPAPSESVQGNVAGLVPPIG